MALSRVSIGARGAVAAEQPLASLAGYEALKNGGNAADAAAAIAYSLAVTFYPANGLGGDFFALYYEADKGRVHCLNSSGWAPSGLDLSLVRAAGHRNIPLYGPLSVVVPGFVAGVSALHSRFGRSDFRRLLSPAVRFAEEGFPALDSLCRSTSANLSSFSPAARKVYAPGGRPPTPGDLIRQPALARVIREVSEEGPGAFYGGWPAEAICKTLQGLGVPSLPADFSEFRPEWAEPLESEYRGLSIHEVPPNSMGATCLLMLKELERTDLSKTGPLSMERVKATMRAAEVAYERKERMLGDPRFVEFDVKAFLDSKAIPPPGRRPKVSRGDTTAFSVTDKEGNILSGIQSLYHHFGSRVFVERCGFMLSNRGAGFRMDGPNRLEPRKRPVHTLSAMLLGKEGSAPTLSIGCSGGDYRPMQHTLFVTNIVDYGMSLERSIEHQRFLWSGGRSMVAEEGYRLDGLKYQVRLMPFPGGTGVCQGVEVLEKAKKAVCDVRGDGLPVSG